MAEKYKGDYVESGMHGIWHLLGGKKYLATLLKKGKSRSYAL